MWWFWVGAELKELVAGDARVSVLTPTGVSAGVDELVVVFLIFRSIKLAAQLLSTLMTHQITTNLLEPVQVRLIHEVREH